MHAALIPSWQLDGGPTGEKKQKFREQFTKKSLQTSE
jgi:hypothetical protein